MAILALLALAFVFAPFQVWAAPIPGPPTPIGSSGGPVTAVYVFADADDKSILSETFPDGISPIFCNHSVSGCIGSSAGATLALGSPAAGSLVFSLQDFTVPNTFFTNLSGADGFSHDKVSATVLASNAAAVAAAYLIYGEGAIPAAAAAAIAALGAADPLTTVTFIGWEDRIGGDYDYNDLIFAFTNIVRAPEPATLLLLGAGLVGVAGLGRMRIRRKKP